MRVYVHHTILYIIDCYIVILNGVLNWVVDSGFRKTWDT